MKFRLSCVLAAVTVSSAVSAADLRLETVLPERTAFAFSLTGVDALMERLGTSGVLEAIMEESPDDMKQAALEAMPKALQKQLIEAMGDRSPIELLKGMSMGGGVWPAGKPGGPVPIDWLAWCNLGALAQPMGEIIDEAFTELRSNGEVSTERVGGVDVDHYGSDRGSDSYWFVHRSPLVLVSSSKAGIERMLAVLADEPVDGTPLGETETWMEASTLMAGTSGMRCVLMPEVMLDLFQMTPEGAMVGMIRPVAKTVLGGHEAIALRLDAGKDDVIIEVQGGAYMPDGVEGLLSLVENASGSNKAIKQFGDVDTVAVSEINIAFNAVTDLVDQLLASSPILYAGKQPFDQMRPLLEDFLSPLGKQVTQIVSVQQPVTADSLRSLTIVEVDDPRSLEDAFSKHLAEGGFEVREFQGRQIWSMQLPSIMPGMPAQSIAMVVAGDWMLLGDDASVEAGLRLITAVATKPAWANSMPHGLARPKDAAMKGMVDLHGSFATLLKIEALKDDRIRKALQAEDPELWEELAGDMADEDSTMLHQAKALARAMGLFLWAVQRNDRGFTFYGGITAPLES